MVDGALFSIGDPHISQGDGELSGTAIEASLNVLFQVFVRKDFHFPSPLLETADEWIVHGFDEDLNVAMRSEIGETVAVHVVNQHLRCRVGKVKRVFDPHGIILPRRRLFPPTVLFKNVDAAVPVYVSATNPVREALIIAFRTDGMEFPRRGWILPVGFRVTKIALRAAQDFRGLDHRQGSPPYPEGPAPEGR